MLFNLIEWQVIAYSVKLVINHVFFINKICIKLTLKEWVE